MRAKAEAARSAARLAERGFASALAPVVEIEATNATPPPGRFDAVVVTSAQALKHACEGVRAAMSGVPLFLVGAQSARLAVALGLEPSESPSADSAELAERLRALLRPGSRVLYLAGRDRKPELELALGRAGHGVETVEVYCARARPGWSSDEALSVADCDAAMHYSLRSAELAVGLAGLAGIADRFRALTHICISEEAAAPLRDFGAPLIHCAATPDEDALIEALLLALPVGAGAGQ